MTLVLPLWLALLIAAVLIYIAWNVAVSRLHQLKKDAAIGGSVVALVLVLAGGFGYGPLYRPHAPAVRAGCHGTHVCVRLP